MSEKIKLNVNASVVEYNAVRKILWLLGYSAVRDGDNLEVYKKRRKGEHSLYTMRDDDNDVYKFYVDEGSFTDMMDAEGKLSSSAPWEELLDFRELLGLITSKLLPEAKHPGSVSIGIGRAQQERIAGYIKLLRDHKMIEWIN